MMYQLGIDGATTGYYVVSNGKDKIIEAFEFPQKLNLYKKETNELKKKITNSDYKTKKELKEIEDKIKFYKEVDIRDSKSFIKNFDKFKDKISLAVLEKPLMQTASATSIISLMSGSEIYGINRTILEQLEIYCYPISPMSWKEQFNFGELDKGASYKEKRDFSKQESIRIAKERIKNIEDFWIPKECRKINDNIVEASLLSILEV